MLRNNVIFAFAFLVFVAALFRASFKERLHGCRVVKTKETLFFSKLIAVGCCETKSVPTKETRETREDVDETTLAKTSV